jgi:hypothetical protein
MSCIIIVDDSGSHRSPPYFADVDDRGSRTPFIFFVVRLELLFRDLINAAAQTLDLHPVGLKPKITTKGVVVDLEWYE